jgi:hypothetical protein
MPDRVLVCWYDGVCVSFVYITFMCVCVYVGGGEMPCYRCLRVPRERSPAPAAPCVFRVSRSRSWCCVSGAAPRVPWRPWPRALRQPRAWCAPSPAVVACGARASHWPPAAVRGWCCCCIFFGRTSLLFVPSARRPLQPRVAHAVGPQALMPALALAVAVPCVRPLPSLRLATTANSLLAVCCVHRVRLPLCHPCADAPGGAPLLSPLPFPTPRPGSEPGELELDMCVATLRNGLTLAIRRHVLEYSQGWCRCDDAICGMRTRQQPLARMGKGCVRPRCRGILRPESTDEDLHTQVPARPRGLVGLGRRVCGSWLACSPRV